MGGVRGTLRAWILLALLGAGCGDHDGLNGAPLGDKGAGEALRFGGLADVRAAIAEQKGHAVLVNFWATWCPPCVAELPALRDVAAEFEPQGVRVLGVSFDLLGPGGEREAAPGKVRSFLEARDLALPTLILEPAEYAALRQAFKLPGAVPVTLALDRSGAEVDRHLGEASAERFREMLQKALAP